MLISHKELTSTVVLVKQGFSAITVILLLPKMALAVRAAKILNFWVPELNGKVCKGFQPPSHNQDSLISCVLQDFHVLILKPQSAWTDHLFFGSF